MLNIKYIIYYIYVKHYRKYYILDILHIPLSYLHYLRDFTFQNTLQTHKNPRLVFYLITKQIFIEFHFDLQFHHEFL